MATRTWLAGSDDHAATGGNWANGLPQSGDVLNITTGGTIDFTELTGDFSATIAGPLQVSGTVDLSDVALQPYNDPVTKVSSSIQGQ